MQVGQSEMDGLALATPHPGDWPLEGFTADSCLDAYRAMMAIRVAESCLAANRRDGLIGGPVHLGVGQEAIAVGVTMGLRATDRVFGAHRSHAHLLALGASQRSLFAEVLGKETGASRGMGGSMHLWDQPHGFYGSVPIVAGTVALAVGAGLAAKMQGTADIALAYFGDGAAEEGAVHESLNFAALAAVPVLFVVENNQFASHMHIGQRQPSERIARLATAQCIASAVVDGNDVLQVGRVARGFIERARAGGGPALLECLTYRWYGHVDWREDIDVGVHRSTEELAVWRERDPIRRLAAAMISQGWATPGTLATIDAELESATSQAWRQAMADPYPDQSAMLDRVYAPGSDIG